MPLSASIMWVGGLVVFTFIVVVVFAVAQNRSSGPASRARRGATGDHGSYPVIASDSASADCSSSWSDGGGCSDGGGGGGGGGD